MGRPAIHTLKRIRGQRGRRTRRNVDSMTPRLLILVLVFGCAPAPDPAPVTATAAESQQVEEDQGRGCRREATVTVHVENRSGTDVSITFGSYAPVRAAPAFSWTTYQVPRYHLQGYIRLRIERGGLEVGTPPSVATEFVVCNDATLIIGPRPRYSFFYGDLLPRPARAPERDDDDSVDTATSASR